MFTPFEARYHEVRRRILDAPNHVPPEYQKLADENANVTLHDLDERLMCCADDGEADALVRRWLAVTA